MLEWLTSNIEAVRMLAYTISGAAGGASAFATILNIKRKLAERRKIKKALREDLTREVGQWYRNAFRLLVIEPNGDDGRRIIDRDGFLEMTVQEACAWAGMPVPSWAVNGLERTKVRRFS